VSILVAAHKEAANIGRFLDLLAQLNYPAAKREILLCGDAATDDT